LGCSEALRSFGLLWDSKELCGSFGHDCVKHIRRQRRNARNSMARTKTPKTEAKVAKKRRFRAGPNGVRSRQAIKRALKRPNIVPLAFFRRELSKLSLERSRPLRFSSGAIVALKAAVEARVHRQLSLGTTLARFSKRRTYTTTHLEMAGIILDSFNK
jgi:hypothetical protein